MGQVTTRCHLDVIRLDFSIGGIRSSLIQGTNSPTEPLVGQIRLTLRSVTCIIYLIMLIL